jgi:hypothetical protein
MTNGHLVYSATEIDMVERWLREGCTASQIATRFSTAFRTVSRNGIIGLVHRDKRLAAIGLAAGRRGPKPGSQQAAGLKNRAVANGLVIQSRMAGRAMAPGLKATVAPGDGRAFDAARPGMRLADLARHHCRWPVRGAGETTLFCAEAIEPDRIAPGRSGGSYCAHHRSRMAGRGTESERVAHRALLAAR